MLFTIAGVLVTVISFAAVQSDIQLILAGVFVLALITAFGFAAVVKRLDHTIAQDSKAYKDLTA